MAGCQVVGARCIGIRAVPAVTTCGHSRAPEIGDWTGYHSSHAKSRINSAAANLPR